MAAEGKQRTKGRFDSKRVRLKKGEYERPNGTYEYRWVGKATGKRHVIYAKTLDELRVKEEEVVVDRHDGIRADTKSLTINDVYKLWKDLKRGIKDNTLKGYEFSYEMYVESTFGKKRIVSIRKSDIKSLYNSLFDERHLSISSIDIVHNVLHQVFQLAVDDDIIRKNPTDNMLKELKQSHNFEQQKRKALTVEQQKIFLDYMKSHIKYAYWYPIFFIMLNTGMRVGEITGLRWCDIDLDKSEISINHTLVYYDHRNGTGMSYNINTPKTKAGERIIPMTAEVKAQFIAVKEFQKENSLKSISHIDGYSDFVFINHNGEVYNQGLLNKAIRRIIRDCNDEILLKNNGNYDAVLLPPFSCHSLRHTFATRLCEAGINIKVIQDVLGHADISTTMNIYVDVTSELKQKEFSELDISTGTRKPSEAEYINVDTPQKQHSPLRLVK